MQITSYKDLIVWQKGIELVKEIYILTSKFPPAEIYGLVSQMRRSAVSIPSNIAEGRQRSTRKDFVQFLRIAQGSVAELETQIIISKNLFPSYNYVNAENLLNEIQKMLAGMMKKLLEFKKLKP